MTEGSLAIDHVIAVVDDLDAAAVWLLDAHGLGSVPGGRHPGHGTGNRIVPLGSDYLELMAVVDPGEASASPLGRWAARHARRGVEPAALCLRTGAIAAVAATLGEEPLAMSRRTAQGGELWWRLAGLDGMLEHGHPFFIEWSDPAAHPGRAPAPHRVVPRGIASVALGAVPERMRPLLEGVGGLAPGGVSGVGRVVIDTDAGPVELH